eukprot:TRINITY_DN13626_c0_g1_i2.p1 TRINITY_DN13626_c0_g1~~TRINITY_DN13626_c0_g1_i2.p1  ORF type:complete len:2325 (-),score=316.51 TRINITY_DN13626_c0_g1_i2:28-7002(-)
MRRAGALLMAVWLHLATLVALGDTQQSCEVYPNLTTGSSNLLQRQSVGLAVLPSPEGAPTDGSDTRAIALTAERKSHQGKGGKKNGKRGRSRTRRGRSREKAGKGKAPPKSSKETTTTETTVMTDLTTTTAKTKAGKGKAPPKSSTETTTMAATTTTTTTTTAATTTTTTTTATTSTTTTTTTTTMTMTTAVSSWLANEPAWSRKGSASIGVWVSNIADDPWHNPEKNGPSNLLEGGSWVTKWGATDDQWFKLDLGMNFELSSVKVRSSSGHGNKIGPKNMKWQQGASLSGPWTDVAAFVGSSSDNIWTQVEFAAVNSRYWRLLIVDSYRSGGGFLNLNGFGCFGISKEAPSSSDASTTTTMQPGTAATTTTTTTMTMTTAVSSWLANEPAWSRKGSASIGVWVSNIADDPWHNPEKNGPSNLLEGGSWVTKWGATDDQWFKLDLGMNFELSSVKVRSSSGHGNKIGPKNMKWQQGASLSGPWTDVAAFVGSSSDNIWTQVEFAAVNSRYWRLLIVDSYRSGGGFLNLNGFGCFGISKEAPSPLPSATTTTTMQPGNALCHVEQNSGQIDGFVPSKSPASCSKVDYKFTPIDMPGQSRTVAPAASGCQQRCAGVAGCAHFSWWSDGGCHIQDKDAVKAYACGVTSGPPSCGDGSKEGVYLGEGCDARNISLTTGIMGGAWCNHGVPIQAVIFEKLGAEATADSKDWLLVALEGDHVKLLVLNVYVADSKLYMAVDSAGYHSEGKYGVYHGGCPDGTSVITKEEQCKEAADLLSHRYGWSGYFCSAPGHCSLGCGNKFYFNTKTGSTWGKQVCIHGSVSSFTSVADIAQEDANEMLLSMKTVTVATAATEPGYGATSVGWSHNDLLEDSLDPDDPHNTEREPGHVDGTPQQPPATTPAHTTSQPQITSRTTTTSRTIATTTTTTTTTSLPANGSVDNACRIISASGQIDGFVPANPDFLCTQKDSKFEPIDMPGQSRTVAPAASGCQKRCAGVAGCAHFSWWSDGGCHIQDRSAVKSDAPGVTSGPPSCEDGNEKGVYLGAGCDARHIVLTSATMNGLWVGSGAQKTPTAPDKKGQKPVTTTSTTAAPAIRGQDYDYLKAHNIYRCMHGVSPVTWSEAAAKSAQEWANSLTSLSHANSYAEEAPAGPAGENLAMGYQTVEGAVGAWYKEVDCCEWPGCAQGSCVVGHFTAMIWAGVTEIGCARNKANNIDVCRYRSGDSLGPNTANMQGYHEQQVFQAKKSYEDCAATLDVQLLQSSARMLVRQEDQAHQGALLSVQHAPSFVQRAALPLQAVVFERTTEGASSKKSKKWLLAAVEGDKVKIVELNVKAVNGGIYLNVESAGFHTVNEYAIYKGGCQNGASEINDAATCQAAASTLGNAWNYAAWFPQAPPGCFKACRGFYFNTQGGTASSSFQSVCTRKRSVFSTTAEISEAKANDLFHLMTAVPVATSECCNGYGAMAVQWTTQDNIQKEYDNISAEDAEAEASKSCKTIGPSTAILENSGGQASGASWPYNNIASKEACAELCRNNGDCGAFHYYGPSSSAYGHCYLHKSGTITQRLTDKVDLYVGTCAEATTTATTAATTTATTSTATTMTTTAASCIDTPNWDNAHAWGAMNCAQYESRGLCANGAPTRGVYGMGEKYNFPEKNCCSCGKSTSAATTTSTTTTTTKATTSSTTAATTSATTSSTTAATTSAVCTYEILWSRSDHAGINLGPITVTGSDGDSFSFSGCTTQGSEGQKCLTYGIQSGVRTLINSHGKIVGTGVCCNDVTNTVVSTTKNCQVEEHEGDGSLVPGYEGEDEEEDDDEDELHEVDDEEEQDTTQTPAPTGSSGAPAPHPGGFCGSRLYSDLPDSETCEDGSKVGSNGCCAATNNCPEGCSGKGWSMSGGVKTCLCSGCPYGLKLNLTLDERYLRATNYFRCRHGQPLMKWDAAVARNADAWASTCAGQYGHSPHTRPDGTNAYALEPMSGENVAVGSKSPEKAVELWYNEITDPGFTPGRSPDLQPGTGHYTAMMWADTGTLGCAQKPCPGGSPAPVHVCHYAYSAPNVGEDSDYEANLPKTNEPIASEETCCQAMYGDLGKTNPHLNPLAPTTTPEPLSTQGPTVGIFISNEGTRYVQVEPWQFNSMWVYGAYEGGWFKMVSVDKDGQKLESRHSKTHLTDSMSPSQLQAVWDAANPGGDYSVEVTLGDTSAPAPAVKENTGFNIDDAEGTIYVSNTDEDSRRRTIRRRMRGEYYAISPQATFRLVKSGGQCRSKSKWYGCWLRTQGDCARKAKKEGKRFFIFYSNPAMYDYKCYIEETSSASCPEGFSDTGWNSRFNFYEVLA